MEPLHGVLDMLVLRSLIFGPLHGYGVAKAIKTSSTDALDIEFGSLYPALKRLESNGFVVSKWEMSEFNRRAKFYSLTEAGRKRLQDEHSQWRDFAAAVARVMGPAPEAES
jgi:PadR family transcriptional regulator, regulatory protein PadR